MRPCRALVALVCSVVSLITFTTLTPASQLAPDLLSWLDDGYLLDERAALIVQLHEPLTSSELAYLFDDPGSVTAFPALGMLAAELTARELPRVAAHPKVAAISLDRQARAAGSASRLQAIAGAREVIEAFGYQGRGVGIAVLDSGLSPHPDLAASAAVSFVPDEPPEDGFGHGTHVAGVIAGSGRASVGLDRSVTGIAPAADLVSVRVLDDQGLGTLSWTLAGIDWLLRHREQLNVRIVNMSLAAASSESYRTDPLCQATRRLHDAGIVTIAAAGNLGQDEDGTAVHGAITAPGNSPWVITVGAASDAGTEPRHDDRVAAYSSRGPTRSFEPVSGSYDHLIKPDLVAHGSRIVSARAAGSFLAQDDAAAREVSPPLELKPWYLKLHGTSVATGVVTGIVALMLEANPSLDPSSVKALLVYTAQPLDGATVFEQGAGLLNAAGAVRMAHALRRAPLTSAVPGDVLLAREEMPAAHSKIGGGHVPWAAGHVSLPEPDGEPRRAGGVLLADDLLISEDGVLYSEGIVFAEDRLITHGIVFAERSVVETHGVIFAERRLESAKNGLFDASSVPLGRAIALGNASLGDASGSLYVEDALIVDGVCYMDGIIFAERRLGRDDLEFLDAEELSRSSSFAHATLLDASTVAAFTSRQNGALRDGEPRSDESP
ncbi:MAG: S8 family peptidase [Acidobacteriota bacterium]|nr:MAG: S8 family peptidase [Acidobacteriota bacterium]